MARGDTLDSSDIDIAILGKEKVNFEIMSKILREKEVISTLRSIDIVDLNTKSEDFRNKALEEGKLLD